MGEKTSGREGEWRREIKEEKEVKEKGIFGEASKR